MRLAEREPRQRRSTLRRVAAALLVLIGLYSGTPLANENDFEYNLKAEFIDRFAAFIEWPAGTFASPDAPFVLCMVGGSPIEPFLRKFELSRRIKEHHMVLRHIGPTNAASGCHLVFIAVDDVHRLQQVLSSTSGKPILTVADRDGYGSLGVLINLYVAEGHVHFEINASETKKSGLKFSSQLLKLARLIGAP
jgi:hypothetical protein